MDLQAQLQGYRLTTAEILYGMPDHPSILQSFVWQALDIAPKYPILGKFLGFWETEIEAKIRSVRVSQVGIISPSEVRHTEHMKYLH